MPAARGRPSAIKELEAKYEKALAAIDQLSQQNAVLSAQLGAGFARSMPSGSLVVGIRNISNYTVSFEDTTSGQPVTHQLHPEVPGMPDPKSRAVISYVFWQQLRTSKLYRQGLLIRDDSVVGPADNLAPPDRPEDLPQEAVVNQILDPRGFIVNKSEEELRQAVTQITSSPSLRRIIEAVDAEVQRLADTKYAGDPERPKKAVRDLGAQFRIAEELAYDRLDELNPYSGNKEDTSEPRVNRRFARA